ncbi:hypothetical protein DPEC_G00145430 [Dallia pectoralis]|uniref:Uncharacterized protein n=1 Tax=Dallia pectoralis TaxID=75939 RepID=A0ACC2GP31_DALPE|nr:hypothetical protein DPEC_G00145430 [Dallia pectoralis]
MERKVKTTAPGFTGSNLLIYTHIPRINHGSSPSSLSRLVNSKPFRSHAERENGEWRFYDVPQKPPCLAACVVTGEI